MAARSAFHSEDPPRKLAHARFRPSRTGRVKSLWGIQLFGCVLTRLMPDPVALRGMNSYSKFSSRAMARATASAATSTSVSLKRMTFHPRDSRCLYRFKSFSATMS